MKIILFGLLLVFAIAGYVVYQQTLSDTQNPVVASDTKPTADSETVDVVEKILPASQPSSLKELSSSAVTPEPYREFVNPSAYLHTDDMPISIGEQVGKKIILQSFMTYSCINCQRTFPTLVRLDETYRDDGLLIIGIHTPEFAFEHDPKRVEQALAEYGVMFPVILDNRYETWNAYENRFWPRRYIIDVTGNIVYDHIGEGDYEGTERVIKALLTTLPTV